MSYEQLLIFLLGQGTLVVVAIVGWIRSYMRNRAQEDEQKVEQDALRIENERMRMKQESEREALINRTMIEQLTQRSAIEAQRATELLALGEFKANFEHMKQRVALLEKSLSETQEELASERKRNIELTRTNEIMRVELERVTQENSSLLTRVNMLENELARLKSIAIDA